MDINSVDNGVMRDTAVRVATPEKTTESSRPAQLTKFAPSSQPAQKADANADLSPAQVKQIVADMQKQVDGMNIAMEYAFYGENDNKVAIKVMNKETGEVIREIPSKELQSLQTKIGELVGRIFNGKA
ncbi:MAG: flagellar protein FlaG [Syntrophales bacterium]